MANFIKFNETFKLVDLKATFNLATALGEERTIFNSPAVHNAEAYQQFIDKVVDTVKKTYLTATEETCCISLENDPHPPSPNLSASHLIVVAQALYRSFGIAIKEVDAMSSPRKMVVSWPRDHAMFFPFSLGLIKYRKDVSLSDCTLKFGDQLFPAHRMILAIKSSYFEKAFKSGCKESAPNPIINIEMEHLEKRSIEILLDYFYIGELHLESSSITQIDNLVNLSSYFVLPHLEQMCFEYMCKHVNADNLPAFYELAKHYNHEELQSALLHHVRKEVNPDNIASLILLARAEKLEGLEEKFLLDISLQVDKIDYSSCIGETTRVDDFAKFLDIAIQYQSVPILDACVKKMQKICDNLYLPTLIAYLALTSQYSSRFECMPDNENRFQTLQKNFHKQVLDWFKGMILRTTYDSMSDSPSWNLVEEGLTTAITYNLQEIRIACEDVLIFWISNKKDRDKIAVIAKQFSLTRVLEACQKQAVY